MGLRGRNSEPRKNPLVFSRRQAFRGILLFLYGMIGTAISFAQDLGAAVTALEKRYSSVASITGDFRQIYKGPGIEQVESGNFKMKRPGLMRWEYRQPEEKLFVADGREAFLYVPLDRQVTVQPFGASELRSTPLDFLLGGGNILKNFAPSWETRVRPLTEKALQIRLTPRKAGEPYEYIVLELDSNSYDLRRITIREEGGNTSEFVLANVTANAKIGDREFQFKPPKGVEVVRLGNNDQ
jgi:outer membrane lipoprotein carrier protein